MFVFYVPYAVLLATAFYRWFDGGETGLSPEAGDRAAIAYNENAAPTAR